MDPSSGRRMHEEFTVVIDRPVEEVFAFVTDLPRTPEWRTTVRQADPLTWQGTSAVGARFGAATGLGGVLGRVVVPVIARGMRRQMRAQVGNLKRLLES